MIETLLTSLQRFIKSRGKLTLAEKKIISFFENVIKTKEHSFTELYAALENILFTDRESRRIIEYFDVLAWAKSKMDKMPMAEVIVGNAEEIVEFSI